MMTRRTSCGPLSALSLDHEARPVAASVVDCATLTGPARLESRRRGAGRARTGGPSGSQRSCRRTAAQPGQRVNHETPKGIARHLASPETPWGI